MADYDYIIVGAGSAGGALAARLTENSTVRVLLLEAGAASHPYSRMPLSLPSSRARASPRINGGSAAPATGAMSSGPGSGSGR